MRRIKKAPVIVMNFSGAYKMEQFADNPDFIHIDCSDISGTDCILSAAARKTITDRISGYVARGIHFIDSGDYHYMTKLWTDKIDDPFTLLLVDHHTDMQPSLVPGVLTCGDWVDSVIRQNKNLKEVLLIGTPREALKTVPENIRRKVRYVDYAEFERIVTGRHELSKRSQRLSLHRQGCPQPRECGHQLGSGRDSVGRVARSGDATAWSGECYRH